MEYQEQILRFPDPYGIQPFWNGPLRGLFCTILWQAMTRQSLVLPIRSYNHADSTLPVMRIHQRVIDLYKVLRATIEHENSSHYYIAQPILVIKKRFLYYMQLIWIQIFLKTEHKLKNKRRKRLMLIVQ